MLAEVARCLPPGVRPHLASASLTLSAGQDGNLTAAPIVTFSEGSVSSDDRREADLIVQAALQCGPYKDPMLAKRTLAVAADFSALQAPPATEATSHVEAPSVQLQPVATDDEKRRHKLGP